jgi:uncharacterized SAM-binding protein YcdF (DUF218 family)
MASSGHHPQHRLYGILNRRERWGLSWRGWLLLVSTSLAAAYIVFSNVQGFLATTHRVDTDVLVMEGWIQKYAIRAAATEFQRGGYKEIYTTGGPENGTGAYVNDYQTSANIGAEILEKFGVPQDHVQIAPSHVNERDRTYSSAVALRNWLRDHNVEVQAFNVITEGCHARRTQLLFQEAFGEDVSVGVIAVPNPDYDPKYWWHYSDGVREVIGESLAYVYARLFFVPSQSGNREQSGRISQARR